MQKKIEFSDIIHSEDEEVLSLSKITNKFLDIVFWVENYLESENLLLENSDNLVIKDKYIF